MASEYGLLEGNDVVETAIRVEGRFGLGEGDDGTIGTTTADVVVSKFFTRDSERQAYPNWPRACISGENAIASWKVRRKDSCASSAHWLWKRSFMISSRRGKRAQHAALVAVFLPSGQATRLVSAAGQKRKVRAVQRVDRGNTYR